jgi:deoxycytidine triphosphate deaminase
MVLSDRSLREALAAGRIVVDPLDESCIQPSSIDVKVSNLFRVFRNHTAGVIDVKQDLEDLTELITIPEEGVFMLHPGEFVLGSTLERIAVPNDLVGRVEGKALAAATDVPTPDGWRTMADLRPGDHVFSEHGRPVRIKDATEVMLGRPCREVELSDGMVIIADASHLWLTTSHEDRRRASLGVLRTTDDVARRVKDRKGYVHQIDLPAAIQYAEQDLPIDPYVLGVWLGDGTATKAEVTTVDEEILDHIARAGYAVWPTAAPAAYRIGGFRSGNARRDPASGRHSGDGSLNSTLRAAGLLANKHVPEAYLRASHRQRFSLLQGLMDTDGHLDAWGRAEFCNRNERLALAVRELVASLGMKTTMSKDRARLYGVDCGPRYRVRFTPDRPVFRLSRKVTNLKLHGRTHLAHSIVAVREIPSVPVRCIEVDSPTGMYLITRSYVPTHNSSLGRLGLLIHSTAGFIDAGFDGHITLELANVASLPITIYPRMKIGQVSFLQMTTPADNPYGSGAQGSKYQGQRGPTPSRYFENFRKGDE